MLSQEDVFELFKPVAARVTQELYLTVDVCRELVEVCDSNCLAILGLDGLPHGSWDRAWERTDLILDCSTPGGTEESWESFRKNSIEAARHFLTEHLANESGVLVIPTMVDEANWKAWRTRHTAG